MHPSQPGAAGWSVMWIGPSHCPGADGRAFYLLVERLVRCVWLCVEQTHLLMPYLAFGQPYPVATSHAGPVEWIVSHMAGESGLVCWVWCCVQEWSGSCMWCGREVLSVWSCGHVWCGGGGSGMAGMSRVCVRVCAYLLSRLVTTTWLLEDVPLLRSVTPSIPLYYCRGNMSYFLSNVN